MTTHRTLTMPLGAASHDRRLSARLLRRMSRASAPLLYSATSLVITTSLVQCRMTKWLAGRRGAVIIEGAQHQN
jgi:hypothetical protein